MGGMFSKPKKPNTAKFVERPGVALEKDLPSYTRAAQQATAARLAEIERVMPGATAQRQQAGDITASWMRGELPQDVQEQTMRNIAEYGGAGFNPATAGRAGGFQMAQGMVPRQFGLQSQQLQEKGMSIAAGWQQLADSFAYDPFEAAQFAGPSAQYGQAKSGAAARDEAAYQQAVATQQKNIMGAATAVASLVAAPFIMPALAGGLASGAAGLGLGTTASTTSLAMGGAGTGLAGSFQNMALGTFGSGGGAGSMLNPLAAGIY
jgi:hypothetical protein